MKVLFLDELHEILEQELTANGYECINGVQANYEQLCELLADAEGLVVRSRFYIDENFLKYGLKLKFIARSGAGIENIDQVYCKERGIKIFNAPEGNRTAVAEHALGLLLNLFNHISKGNDEVRKGVWDREGNRGIELTGRTVGIIGFGNNGSQFAKVLQGFDCEILAYDKYKTGFGNDFVKEVEMQEIFDKAEVISLHIPQTEETIRLGSSAFFNSFKNAIYLLNNARGKIVDTHDLLQAIEEGKVLGAGLDVSEYEALFKSGAFSIADAPEDLQKLLQSKKVLLTPHVAGWTVESYHKLSKVLAEKIIKKMGSNSASHPH